MLGAAHRARTSLTVAVATAQHRTAQRCASLRLRALDALAPPPAHRFCDKPPPTTRSTFTVTSNPTFLSNYISRLPHITSSTPSLCPCSERTMLCHSLLFRCARTLPAHVLSQHIVAAPVQHPSISFHLVFRLRSFTCSFFILRKHGYRS